MKTEAFFISPLKVAVIDSGWDRKLHDSRILNGIGLVQEDFALHKNDDDQDRLGHGTACSSIILQYAPFCQIFPIRIFGNTLETSVEVLCTSLRYAIDEGFKLVNMSLGTLREDAKIPLYALCEEARSKDMIIVAAMANEANWSYPAVFDNVLSVGISANVEPTLHYQPNAAIECLANGLHWTTWLDGEARFVMGTSFAAPFVTAKIAHFLYENPTSNLDEVRNYFTERFHSSAHLCKRLVSPDSFRRSSVSGLLPSDDNDDVG